MKCEKLSNHLKSRVYPTEKHEILNIPLVLKQKNKMVFSSQPFIQCHVMSCDSRSREVPQGIAVGSVHVRHRRSGFVRGVRRGGISIQGTRCVGTKGRSHDGQVGIIGTVESWGTER